MLSVFAEKYDVSLDYLKKAEMFLNRKPHLPDRDIFLAVLYNTFANYYERCVAAMLSASLRAVLAGLVSGTVSGAVGLSVAAMLRVTAADAAN